jgi:predicted permease
MTWLTRLLNVFRRGRLDRDIDAELAFHLDMRAGEFERQGMAPAEARLAAARLVGNTLALRDRTREVAVAVRLETAWLDAKHGLRMLLRTPGFTVPAVLTLALGIGVNTAMFALLYGTLLRPLPFRDPDRLYMLFQTSDAIGRTRVAPLDFFDWRARTRTFAGLAAHAGTGFTLSGSSEPELVIGQLVSADLLDILGVRPAVGRSFRPDENEAGRNQVVILSHALWHRRFGGDPAIVGRTMTANAKPYTVIGVMPADFAYPGPRYELWTPFPFLGANTDNLPINRDSRYLQVIGRLRDGETPERARAEMAAIARDLARQFPDSDAGRGIALASLLDETVGEVRAAVMLMFGAAVFVLLIACANVASLLLARFSARDRELGIRAALGATRIRLARQFLTETVLLYAIGSLAGLALASGLLRAIVTLAPEGLPRVQEFALVGPVIWFALGVGLVAALVFGLAPLWEALAGRGPGVTERLTARGTTSGRRQQRFRTVVLGAQLAVAVVLATGATLAVRSLVNLQSVPKGFDPSQTVTFDVVMTAARFSDAPAMHVFYRRLLDAFRSQSRFEAVGLTTALPLSGQDLENGVSIPGFEPSRAATPVAGVRGISPGYLAAMRLPLRRGRDISQADREDAQLVVLVNEAFARRYWPGRDPVGRQVAIGDADSPLRMVVGLVADVKHRGLDADARPEIFVPYLQLDPGFLTSWARGVSVVIRSRAAADTVVATARQQLRAVDPALPVIRPRPMSELVSEALGQPRFRTFLLGTFALLALAVSLVGVFGLTSYFVSQRTREIGVRMALGARTADVLRSVLVYGSKVVGVGVVVGIAASFAVTRSMRVLLYGVTPEDPLTFTAVAALLALGGLVACYWPARRATRIDPTVALRAE